MVNYIHSIRTIALLIVAVIVSIGPRASGLAHAAPDKAVDKVDKLLKQISKENRKGILKRNDYKLKAREPLYPQHAASLATQYRETAKIVARQGGNAQALLVAAAYFEGESELYFGPIDRAIPNDHASGKHKHAPAK